MSVSSVVRAFAAAVGGVLVAASSIPAQNAGTSNPAAPATAPARGPSVEGITEYRLTNGLRVLLFPDRSKPQTTVNVTYLVGSRHEGYGETGMAHLLEHMLFKGTPRHRAPSAELSAHGAQFDATTSFDRTNFFETFAAADTTLAWALDLEADRMTNSLVAKEDLDKEFSVVRSEFERGENDPFLVTLKRVLGSAYLFHAYSRLPIGSQSDIENVPIDRLQRFYHKHYQPDNAIVMIAGNFDEARALALVQEKFAGIPRAAQAPEATYTVEPTQDGERTTMVRRAGDGQVVMAYYHVPAGTHPDFPAIDVLTRVLGEQGTGRLFKSLIEPKRAASVQAENLQQHDPAGLFVVARLKSEQSVDSAQRALLAASEEVGGAKPPTAEEVERAKASILKNFERAPSNTGTFGLQLSEWMGMGDWRLFFYHREQVKKVTVQDVQRVAAAYLKPSNRTVGIFVPTDKPDRAEIAAAPNTDSLLKNFRSEAVAVAAGEAFDPTPANIEGRVHRSTLPSGLKVAMLAKKNRGETVSAVVSLRLGSAQTLTNRSSAAAIAAQMLMRGTKSLSRQQITDTLNALKARVAVAAPNATNVRVSIETTRNFLPAALALVGEMLRAPALDSAEFERTQREMMGQVETQRTEPVMLAQLAVARKLSRYPAGHPRYVAMPDEQLAGLKAATVTDVRAFHRDFYGASAGELVIVGDVDEAAASAAARAAFGTWKSAKPFRYVPVTNAAAKGDRQSIETPDKPNAAFMVGESIAMQDIDAEYPAMVLANYLLGESALDSRLPARIRVKEGLSYIVQTGLNVASLDRAGQWLAIAIASPANTEKVNAAFFDEMAKITKEGFSAEEVAKGKSALLQRRAMARSNDAQLATQLANALYYGRTMRFDEELEQHLGALSAEQVNAVVRRTLDPQKMVVVQAGDFAKVQQAGKPK